MTQRKHTCTGMFYYFFVSRRSDDRDRSKTRLYDFTDTRIYSDGDEMKIQPPETRDVDAKRPSY